MKRVSTALLVGALSLSASCESFLDVNTNPNAPQVVSPNLYLPPMLHWMVTSPQFEGRFIGRYTQQWVPAVGVTLLGTWETMGYDKSSDNGAQQWRDVYWTLGQNLVDMNTKAEAEQRWDLLGVGMVLKAWGWQALVDTHGPIIVKEAIDQSKFAFNYDTEQYAYDEVKKLLDSALVLFARTDGAVDAAYLARGDKIYGGDRAKWIKLVHGMKAMHLNHYSNKATYSPAQVIAEVDLSLAGNADDPLLTYPNTSNDDTNFWGRTRGNIMNNRQTQFIVRLMDGTQFGGVVDPRISRMLSPAPDGVYRGLDINTPGFGAMPANQQPNNFHGYLGAGGTGLPGRYIFDDKAKIPFMTYSQLQFIKAEAALRMGNNALALTAYTAGVSSHIDFVNARNLDNSQSPIQITSAEKTAFLASPAIVPATLTMSHIMSQKFIAQWGWGHNELWMDMRRFHYTDDDLVSGTKVFRGFAIPTTLFSENNGKLAYRMRPRFNSEYVWNRPALEVIGGLALDYHTVPLWIIQP